MAQISVYLSLKVGNDKAVGEPSNDSIGGVDVSEAIECVRFEQGGNVGVNPRTGQPSGDRTYDPVRITKYLDASSPILAQGLTASKKCEAEFKFFRPADEDGFEHFYTVTLGEARIQSLRTMVQEGDEITPPREEVTFTFSTIRWKHELGGPEHDDSWRTRPAAG